MYKFPSNGSKYLSLSISAHSFAELITPTLMNLLRVVWLFLTVLQFLHSATSSPIDHIYTVGDDVPLFVNKIGPLNNPSETYQYYELPFCLPDKVLQKKETLGEVLNGDRLANALYELKFRVDRVDAVLCQKTLHRNEIAKFRDAIANDYYFQMYYDDLPLWGFIGKVEDSFALEGKGPNYYLFNHVQFDILYNGNQIIEINAFSDPNHSVDITEDVDMDVKFTYSVSWKETSTPFKNRMNRYSRASLLSLHQKIHWFSFIDSIVIIVLLLGFLSLLFMRHLKNDFRKFAGGDEEEDKDVGWKYIHTDVFKCPPHTSLFCAVLGAGTQLLIVVVFLFTLAFLGILYPYSRGALATSLVLTYTLTSAVAGYISASFYSTETRWDRSVLLAGMLFLVPSLLIVLTLNLVAVYSGTTAALPFGTIFVVFSVHLLFGIPLLGLGGLLGYRYRSESQASLAAKKGPREVPPRVWYQKTTGQIFIGGLLPFSAVVLELHQLFTSIWGYKISTLPGVLFITFIILILLTAILSIGLTLFQLTMEDHEWWWRSVLRGGAVAIFMFGYSIYFYSKSNMTGFLQTAFFFGYNACLCYAIFLMLGTISFSASLMLVRRIYRDVKNE